MMVSDTTAVRPVLTRDESGTLLGHTMGLVALTAGCLHLAHTSAATSPMGGAWGASSFQSRC